MEFKEDTLKQLFSAAKDSSYGAYCPYSKFRVGAALLIPEQKFQNENIVTGCNVENASFGLCICAEKVAMCKAISLGLLNPDDANDYTNLSIAIYSFVILFFNHKYDL